ncbi:hypothetical protein MauCBS54593_002916 [Microsporum audouinii]
MRLRERNRLRPPVRYGAGDWVRTKTTGRRGASTTSAEIDDGLPPPPRIPLIARPTAGPPPYIDYNPNSPPAAFPTIDGPRPGNMPPSNNETSSPGNDDNEFQKEAWSDMESSDEDNSGDDNDNSVDVEDYKYLHAPTHVEWKDLNPVIQVEIVQNLTQVYNWPRVVGMLQLTASEQEEAFNSPAHRHKQTEEESRKLNEMQVKQLRALLRIDNSVLRRSRVPGQLVFRNISKQYFRAARNRTTTDHLMIKASELLAARRFLRRLEIDTKYAGEWRNDLATINQAQDNGEDEFRWILDPEDFEQDARNQPATQVDSSSPSLHQSSSSSTNSDIRFINHFASPGGNTYNVPVYERRNLPLPSTPLNAAQQIFGRRKSIKKNRGTPNQAISSEPESSIVRLNVGPEGAAQIQNIVPTMSSLSPQSPQDIPSSPPLPLSSTSDHLSSSSSISRGAESRKRRRPQSAASSSPLGGDDMLPLPRVLSGPWWYNTGQVYPQTGITSSKTLNERLHAVRAESEKNRKSTSLAVGRPLQKPHFNLPIRGSPLMNNSQASPVPCSDDTIPQTPPPGYTDSPMPQSNTQTKKNIKNLVIQVSNKPIGTKVASSSSDNAEKGPPYSPISPQMGTFPVAGVAGSVDEQGQDTDPMDIDIPNPADGREGKREIVIAAPINRKLSAAEKVHSFVSLPSKVQPAQQSSIDLSHPTTKTASESGITTTEPPNIKSDPKSEDTCDDKSFTTMLHVCCDVPPRKPKKEEDECHPHMLLHSPSVKAEEKKETDETQAKGRPTKKKTKCSFKERRRSTRLNGSTAKTIKPRAAMN